MDFEEFIIANGVGELAISSMRTQFQQEQSLSDSLHAKMLDLFKKYLIVGGLPDAVKTFVEEKNVMAIRKIQEDILNLYGIDASKYEKEHAKLKIQRVFSLIPSNLENKKLTKFLKVETYNIHRAFVLSNEQKVCLKDGVTYIPIYYIMFFEPDNAVIGTFPDTF